MRREKAAIDDALMQSVTDAASRYVVTATAQFGEQPGGTFELAVDFYLRAVVVMRRAGIADDVVREIIATIAITELP